MLCRQGLCSIGVWPVQQVDRPKATLGGVFHILRYDNLTLAVKKILRGYHVSFQKCLLGRVGVGTVKRSSGPALSPCGAGTVDCFFRSPIT